LPGEAESDYIGDETHARMDQKPVRFRIPIRPLDIVALLLSVSAVAVMSVHAYSGVESGSQVRIEGPDGTFVYPLESERSVTVDGPLGDTHVEIEHGEVHVTESPCNDKICIAAGWVSHAGEWIACLPNKVFVKIEGERTSPVDAQTF
jgi:hypothetical protein